MGRRGRSAKRMTPRLLLRQASDLDVRHLPATVALLPEIGEAQALSEGLAAGGALEDDDAAEDRRVAHYLVNRLADGERLDLEAGRGRVADELGFRLRVTR